MTYDLTVFDLETTGPDKDSCLPVQIGCLLLSEGEKPLTIMNKLCDPGIHIPRGASKKHGIYDKDVENQDNYLSVIASFVDNLESLNSEKPIILCGHNARGYDIPIVNRIAFTNLEELYPVIDTLHLAFRLVPEMDSHRLELIHQPLTGKKTDNELTHSALYDCQLVADIMEVFEEDFKKDFPTIKDIADYLSEPIVLEKMPFGKHKSKYFESRALDRK